MIVNKEAYEWLFPTINIDNILIDTWFLSKDSLGCFKCDELSVELVCQVINSLTDGEYKITELSTVSENRNIQQYRLIYNAKDRNSTFDLDRIKENNGRLNSGNLNIQFPLKVFSDSMEIVGCLVDNSTEIQFSLIDNTIEVTLDYGSIFTTDNTLYLALIYFYDIGLVKKGDVNEIDYIKILLKENMDINFMVNKLETKGGIKISNSLYQYIKNCVMMIKNDELVSVKDNGFLSAINKVNLANFINKIERIINTDFQYNQEHLIE